jgi:hypothetical protein
MYLQRDLREFVELLNSAGVEYLIVGAHALAYHGHPRLTGDLDLLLRASDSNAEKMMGVLRDFGFGEMAISQQDFLAADRVIQLGMAPNRIDLLTSLTGVDFEQAWQARVTASLDGLQAYILSREHLIANKRALGRKRDLADLERLEANGA